MSVRVLESPVLLAASDRSKFRALQFFRLFIAGVVTFFVASTLELGVSFFWLLLASFTGVIFAGRSLKLGRGLLWVLCSHTLFFLALYYGLAFANILSTRSSSEARSDFLIALLADETLIIVIFYSVAFLSTWIFWRARNGATWEGLIYSTAFIWFMSGHRNYHVDAPKQISSQTWKLDILQRYQVEPQQLFIGLAVVFFCVLAVYFYSASDRPIFGKKFERKSFGRMRFISAPLIPLLLLSALLYYSKLLNSGYSSTIERASEGVGKPAKEGESNLGFHKAVGQTNQPAALVRLEGDYENNPWAPMLYFREGALSEYNGKEFVAAGTQYDADVPRVSPGQPFIAYSQEGGDMREKVVQSVYMLTKHNTPLAIDYPTRIGLIKNPDPERFVVSFQAISQAPNVKLSDLLGQQVGNPVWDAPTLEHYLRAPGSLTRNPPEDISLDTDTPLLDEQHEDLRYLGTARKLAGSLSDPLARTEAIIQYLSEESIYTRDPGHQVTPDGDPVAPYLFGPPKKKRGYCVHFAHAAVYLLRLSGVPARIGTGYLTDLQYAKDGHILLQMGDRHAWPEIYVDGLGWTIVDIQPAQAENEQAPVPDAKLLEELMGKINPTEELIAPPPITDETIDSHSVLDQIANSKLLLPIAYTLLALFFLIKLFLRFAYRLPLGSDRQIALAYAAFASELCDLGLERKHAETRQEFGRRIKETKEFQVLPITLMNERRIYSRAKATASTRELTEAMKIWHRSHDSNHSRIKRYLSLLNPRSLLKVWKW